MKTKKKLYRAIGSYRRNGGYHPIPKDCQWFHAHSNQKAWVLKRMLAKHLGLSEHDAAYIYVNTVKFMSADEMTENTCPKCGHLNTEYDYEVHHMDGVGVVERSVRCRACGNQKENWEYGLTFVENWEVI